jgi:hypothetical protein
MDPRHPSFIGMRFTGPDNGREGLTKEDRTCFGLDTHG